MNPVFENDKFRIEYFPADSVVEFLVKEKEIDVKDVVEMHNQTLALTQTEHYATLFMAMDFFSLTTEARVEGSKRHYSAFVICQAFVVRNMAQRLFGNFIMKMNQPVRETRLFTTREDARKWLRAKVAQKFAEERLHKRA